MKRSYFSVAFCRTFLVLLFISFSLISFAQEDFKPKLGFIDKESVEMTAYPGDSTADAVFLYDYGDVNFAYEQQRGFYMRMRCWVRIKILKESALDRASVTLGFVDGPYAKSEAIENLEGYTYNMIDGRLTTTQMEKKSIKREKISDTYGAYKFNLPNVKKGSVIEYSYNRVTPFTIQDKPDTWTFQASIPIKWSEYKIKIPQYLDYQMIMGGYLALSKNERERVNIDIGHTTLDSPGMSYRFVMKDAPAFSNEPFITTEKDYLSKLSFELSSIAIPGEIVKNYSQTWEHVDETFMNATWFGGELKKNVFGKEITDEILKTAKDSAEKMRMGYAFIQKNMKLDDSKSMSSKGGIKKAFENKKGSAIDINLLLTNLLREVGLDSDPVVLSTRSNGKIHEHLPSLEGFNYVVCHVKIGSREYLLDATQSNTFAGMLPKHAINGRGRVVPKRGAGYFIDLKPRELQNKLEIVQADIFPADGRIKGQYSQSFAGYGALDWRDEHAQQTDQDFTTDFKKQFPEWKVENVVISNKAEKLAESVNIKCDFEIEDENASEQLFYFNPMLVARMLENPLKSPERLYPLDLTIGISSSFIGAFKLPDGYFLDELPKAEMITLPDKAGKFMYQVKQTGNVIQVNSSMTVSKLLFLSEDYPNLREFFERVVQKHAQPLVIKKKLTDK